MCVCPPHSMHWALCVRVCVEDGVCVCPPHSMHWALCVRVRVCVR